MKANRILLLIFSLILISFACSGGKAENDFQLVWSDVFDYSDLPAADKWKYGKFEVRARLPAPGGTCLPIG